jgi:2,4-dienoyl-CoA reductase (NADPH2)
VGSGPAGLTFAKTAFQRGHNVSLYEQSSRLGGQIHLAASLPERREFLSLTTNLEAQIRAAGIQIVLEQRVTPQTIQYLKPDLVVLATGAAPIKPNFPGVDLPHVYQAWDLLDGHVPTIGQKVVVIGGGAVGVEAALYAAHIGALSPEELYFLFLNRAETPEVLFQKAARGPKEVTLVEMTDKIGADIGRTTSWIFRQNLKRAGVKLMNRVKALEVNQGELIVEKNGEPLAIPADTVILALGSRSDNKLYEAITGLGIEARLIGDAVKPAKAYSAVHEAFALALEV